MDNFIKHLLSKLNITHDFTSQDNLTIIRLNIPQSDDPLKQIDILSEFYKTSKEIVNHLQKKSNVVVKHSNDELVIIY